MAPDFQSYDFDNWCDLPLRADDRVIRTPTRRIRVPRVIQLVRYDRLPTRLQGLNYCPRPVIRPNPFETYKLIVTRDAPI